MRRWFTRALIACLMAAAVEASDSDALARDIETTLASMPDVARLTAPDGPASGFGIGSGSDLAWNVLLGAGYEWKRYMIKIGFKWYDIDYQRAVRLRSASTCTATAMDVLSYLVLHILRKMMLRIESRTNYLG